MGDYIENLVEQLLGSTCRLETTDGSTRIETVYSVGWKEIEFNGETVRFPVTLFFDQGEVDGVELHLLKSAEVLDRDAADDGAEVA